jgi:hypothetical protein
MKRFALLFALVATPAMASTVGPVNNPVNHHDYYVTNDLLTWQAARTWAQNLGGDLVAINNSAENQFVTGILPASPATFWLGANDAFFEGEFEWSTFEAFSYTNWAPGEPDDNAALGGNGDYVVIDRQSGQWSDTNGNFLAPGAVAEVVRPIGVAPSPTLSLRAIPLPGRVEVRFELPRPLAAHVGVYDVAGRLVRTLATGMQDEGAHAVTWEFGKARPGLYFVSLRAGDARLTERVVTR